ncbi:MAG: ATP-binding cassette domain-containing protein, partial [Methanosarcinales archaeon]|nr:ATP-binding cassette domain-containing protein [Methanosarcinales archaeon]
MVEEVISLRNVSVHYGDLPVLEDVSLSIYMHDFLGIIGPNGGGKTTLLKVMLGLVKPDSGEVSVFGGDPLQNRRYIG